MSTQNNEILDSETPIIQEVNNKPPHSIEFKRNEYGLLGSVNYSFNEDGSVNWRSMIKPEFLYPNKDWFDLRKQTVPSSAEGLTDKQLLIMLGGIKELAKLRGFTKVKYSLDYPRDNYVVAKCSIEWMPNYENAESVIYEDVANATSDNTDLFCLKFLETIACNRAFVRCVRNFLNIHIVGADEIDKSKNRVSDVAELMISNAVPITAQGALEKAVNELLHVQTLEDFKAFLREIWKKSGASEKKELSELLSDAKEWNVFKDIPSKQSRMLLKLTNEHKKNNKS
jgi:hypothetical protein